MNAIHHVSVAVFVSGVAIALLLWRRGGRRGAVRSETGDPQCSSVWNPLRLLAILGLLASCLAAGHVGTIGYWAISTAVLVTAAAALKAIVAYRVSKNEGDGPASGWTAQTVVDLGVYVVLATTTVFILMPVFRDRVQRAQQVSRNMEVLADARSIALLLVQTDGRVMPSVGTVAHITPPPELAAAWRRMQYYGEGVAKGSSEVIARLPSEDGSVVALIHADGEVDCRSSQGAR